MVTANGTTLEVPGRGPDHPGPGGLAVVVQGVESVNLDADRSFDVWHRRRGSLTSFFRSAARCPKARSQACQQALPGQQSLWTLLCSSLLLLELWALAYCFSPFAASPDGPLFRLGALFVCAKVVGLLAHRAADVPALVGMLVVGLAFKNAGWLPLPPDYVDFIGNLRKAALALIMVRAGLGLDPAALRRLSLVVLGLAVVPATVEVAATIGLSYLLLDLPVIWGVLLGLVLCAVAPSVVMPCFAQLRQQKLGVDKGIDTLVVAAASFDDVIAISLFGLVLSLVFSGGTSVLDILQHPLGLVIGIVYGLVCGGTLQFVPAKDPGPVAMWRSVLVVATGLVVSFGSDLVGFHEAASIGCITTAFVAAVGWRKQGTATDVEDVEEYLQALWVIFEPIMFSLIGADIDISVLEGSVVGLALVCILVGLLCRAVSTWLLLSVGNRFSWRESLFVALAWIPKADVQAALGPLALDAARREVGADQDLDRANAVLLVAVLSILLTAPAGSVVISTLGRRLLSAPSAAPPQEVVVVEEQDPVDEQRPVGHNATILTPEARQCD